MGVEQATAGPGEVRNVIPPTLQNIEFTDAELLAIGRAVVEMARAMV